MPRAINGRKVCTRCKLEKDISEFYIKSRNLDGLDFWCKRCSCEYVSKHKIKYEYNPESQRIYNARFRYKKLGRPIPDEYGLESRTLTHEEGLRRNKERNKKYKEVHREEIRKKAYIYRHSTRGKLSAIRGEQRRRNLASKVESSFTDDEFFFLLEFQDEKCACCGREFSDKLVPCRDHIIPLVLGGAFVLNNVQLLCRSCNSTKHDKIIRFRDVLPRQAVGGM